MTVIALGLNHGTAALDLRQRFSVPGAELGDALRSFSGRVCEAAEVAIVSTCNRTEIYMSAASAALQPAYEWLAQLGRVDAAALQSHSYALEDADAVRHAFRVASGLDSMVLGEPQILGQFKQAVRAAEEAGTLRGVLHQMFQRSFAVAKQVRSTTGIGDHTISMAAASVRIAARIFEDLAESRLLFIGAGAMIESVAAHFAARRPSRICVANRDLTRARTLAAQHGGEAMALADVPNALAGFDVVVSCTASSLPILGLGAVERALKQRRRQPMVFIDLAVPRDVEAEVGDLEDAYLYTVDDLASWVDAGRTQRSAAVCDADAIVEAGVSDFIDWVDQRSVVPLIRALHDQADQWRLAEIARARRAIASGKSIEEAMESLSHRLVHKMLHGPITELHLAPAVGRDDLRTTLSRLFLAQS